MQEEMDNYHKIVQNILQTANTDTSIRAVIAIGSSTRNDVPADEYSDIDLIVATDDIDVWHSGDLPRRFAEVKIMFTEPTLGGGTELRVMYEGYRDVDFIIFTPRQLSVAIEDGTANYVMNRGYRVLYDAIGVEARLAEAICSAVEPPVCSETDFLNRVNDFYFHEIWAAKKLLRGEMWSAKMCMDAYLKNHLLALVQWYTVSKAPIDVWHDGRFLDTWAEAGICEELKGCFAHYDRQDMARALSTTHSLFSRLARDTAQMRRFSYPHEAERTADAFLREKLTV